MAANERRGYIEAANLPASRSSPGAGRGIGRAVALELARAGYSLCLAARSRDELEETRSQSGLPPERALIVLVDLATEDAPDLLIGAALDCYGRIDVLVNNAGWAPPRTPLLKMRPADMDRMIAINLRAPIALTRLAAAAMTPRGMARSSTSHRRPQSRRPPARLFMRRPRPR